jgi:hypothetical protein
MSSWCQGHFWTCSSPTSSISIGSRCRGLPRSQSNHLPNLLDLASGSAHHDRTRTNCRHCR